MWSIGCICWHLDCSPPFGCVIQSYIYKNCGKCLSANVQLVTSSFISILWMYWRSVIICTSHRLSNTYLHAASNHKICSSKHCFDPSRIFFRSKFGQNQQMTDILYTLYLWMLLHFITITPKHPFPSVENTKLMQRFYRRATINGSCTQVYYFEK